MELGQRLKQARLEAGMSQRQLCADVITRNMLSQIENGAARPSMDTLRYLAAQLGKPMAYFLEEETVQLPNLPVMTQARERFAAGDFGGAARALSDYAAPDPVFDAEKQLLQAKITLGLARQAIDQGKNRLAQQLLEEESIWAPAVYVDEGLLRQRLLMLYEAAPETARELLPKLTADDRELLLRAEAQREDGRKYLAAAQDQTQPRWQLLMARSAYAAEEYSEAAAHYRVVEQQFPTEALPRLEECYRELGDYKMAYHYACLRREGR